MPSTPANPWPATSVPLTLRDASPADVERLLEFRNDATYAVLKDEWRA